MSVKVYIKKGQKNYKEAKLVNKLSKAIEKKLQEDPSFASTYKPATNPVELQKQYDMYCIEDAEFTEVKEESTQEIYDKHKEFRDNMAQENQKNENEIISKGGNEDKDLYEDNDSFIDPLNREEPIVRDYVIKSEFPDETVNTGGASRTTFEEPKSFRDSFEMPGDDLNNNPKQSNGQQGGQQKQPKPQKQPTEPVNPNWDDMGNAKKKRSTRKFAKYIVETVCMLAEKGFVWYANKDINDAKLAEYELNNEMDLDLLVTLEDGQEATVKQFFQIQCLRAEQLAKIDPEEKSDLAEALAEVLLEKGVGPTPTQELLLISLKIFGGQAAQLFMLKSQTNSLLNQLRLRKQEELEEQGYTAPRPQNTTPPPQPQQQVQRQEAVEEEVTVEEEVPQKRIAPLKELEEGNFTLLEQIDNPEETKE